MNTGPFEYLTFSTPTTAIFYLGEGEGEERRGGENNSSSSSSNSNNNNNNYTSELEP